MKKCPNCQKTFDDNMKFCQADGTPLVDVAGDQPEQQDPYATMVASKGDMPATPGGQADEQGGSSEPGPAGGDDPYATVVAGSGSSPETGDGPRESETPKVSEEQSGGSGEDLLEIPEKEKEDDIDPLKTMVVSGDTADNIRLNIPEKKSKSEPAADAGSPASPEPPKFNEPDIAPPKMSDSGGGPAASEPKPSAPAPPPSSPSAGPAEPGSPKKEATASRPDAPEGGKAKPIPSPFDDSMPPGYTPPATPPFEASKEKEPIKPEPLNDVKKEEPPKSPFADPAEPAADSDTEGWAAASSPMGAGGGGQIEQSSFNEPSSPSSSGPADPAAAEGENKTLSFVALGLGILSVPCCGVLVISLAAIVVGFLARSKASSDPTVYGGSGLALAGMIMGGITFVIGLILNVLYLLGAIGGGMMNF